MVVRWILLSLTVSIVACLAKIGNQKYDLVDGPSAMPVSEVNFDGDQVCPTFFPAGNYCSVIDQQCGGICEFCCSDLGLRCFGGTCLCEGRLTWIHGQCKDVSWITWVAVITTISVSMLAVMLIFWCQHKRPLSRCLGKWRDDSTRRPPRIVEHVELGFIANSLAESGGGAGGAPATPIHDDSPPTYDDLQPCEHTPHHLPTYEESVADHQH